MSEVSVSVIIPAYNEAKHIRACLESLLHQTQAIKEIIVVDDGSTDGTLDQVALVKSDKIKTRKQQHQGPGKARNSAAQKATGSLLVFVDADMTFDANFVKALIKPINYQVIGTFSKEEYVSNIENQWARAWSLLRGFEFGRMHPRDYPDTQPVFRAIKKSVFLESGGFDTARGYDDDWSISEKLGKQAVAAPGAIFYHANPDSLTEIFIQAKWAAKRTYKFGVWGKMLGIIRASWPVSIVTGIRLAYQHRTLSLFVAQIVYDFGNSVGILEMLFTGKTAK